MNFTTIDAINRFAKECYKNSVAHGFWTGEDNQNFASKIALIHSEVSEALEEFRSKHDFNQTYYREDGKPEGIPSELADIMIRVGDLAARYNIDLGGAIAEKMAYNEKRPMMHGGKAI